MWGIVGGPWEVGGMPFTGAGTIVQALLPRCMFRQVWGRMGIRVGGQSGRWQPGSGLCSPGGSQCFPQSLFAPQCQWHPEP